MNPEDIERESDLTPAGPGTGEPAESTPTPEDTGFVLIDPAPEPEAQAESSGADTPPAPAPEAETPPRRPVQPYDTVEENQGWSEPVYESASTEDQDVYSPGRYAYGAQNAHPAESGGGDGKKGRRRRGRRRHGFLKAVCLVLVCALAAGAASWAVVDYMLDRYTRENGGRNVVISTSVSSGTQDGAEGALPSVNGETMTGNDIYRMAKKQVVGVNTSVSTNVFGQTSTRAVSGSGFIISEDGYIITNYHVISYAVVYGGELTVLTEDGTKYPASIVGYIESNDVAVIKIDAQGLTPAVMGNSDDMLVGEWVYAIGNPLGELEYTMTPGIVSAQDRMITTEDDITGSTTSINMFQISAAVNHGNSGGPVYNTRGEVIGIVTAKYADADSGIEGLGFAIPINDAISIATQLIEHGYVASAGLGITGMNVDQVYTAITTERYGIPYGVYVDTVNPGSAAEAAGIQMGDIITALGGKTVSTMDELKMALRRYSPGDTESITVYRMSSNMRSGETIELSVTFQELVEETTPQQQQQQQQPQYPDTWPWSGWNW